MSGLEVKDLTAGYGAEPIIRNVNFRVDSAQTVAIVGPNGAGKSTFLKAVLSLLPKSSGHVRVGERDVTGVPTELLASYGLGYVPQVHNVFAQMSVQENLEVGSFLRRKDMPARIDRIWTLFPDLKAARKRPAGTLSGGQRNMLAVGRALITEPDVVILDEPTAGISPLLVNAFWSHIQIIKSSGVAVVVVEQNVGRALEECDWVYVLVDGTNRVDGPPSTLTEREVSRIFLQ
ncbi:MAG: ABC transporter ATP-binding protein [Pseudonocardiales bacterium]|nr:MAG: ABC transporter ATP-binding protein [Pseudonocardiales bacterium]